MTGPYHSMIAYLDEALFAQLQSGQGEQYWYGITWGYGLSWLIFALLVGILMVIGVYRKERRASALYVRWTLLMLRLSIILMVVAAMLGWTRYGARTDLPDLVLVIDVSASMSHQDVLDEEPRDDVSSLENRPSRIDRVMEHMIRDDPSRLDDLSEKYNLKVFLVGEGVERVPSGSKLADRISNVQATGLASRLGSGLEDILEIQRGRPTAAIVIWTDGITTDGPAIREAALQSRRRNIPFFTIGSGSEIPPSDYRLSDLRADDVVFVDDLLTLEVRLNAHGMKGENARVVLRRQGELVQLDEQLIAISSQDESHTVRLSHRPSQEGVFDYVVEVELDPRETDDDNNLFTKRVTVRDETIRVLLVQDQPSYEFRFLKQLFGRETTRNSSAGKRVVELTTVLQDAEFEFAQIDEDTESIFPVRREDLFAYDVIILGDVRTEESSRRPGGLSRGDIQNLRDFVFERGGGLILVFGPQHFPESYTDPVFAELMSFNPNGVRVPDEDDDLVESYLIEATEIGLTIPLMMIEESPRLSLERFRSLEGPYWVPQVSQLKPGALVLADTGSTNGNPSNERWPLITLQRIGPGRVLTHFFDESYRWRALLGDLYFERYWIQAIRYLSRQKLLGNDRQVELSAERIEFQAGEPVRLIARFFDPTQIPAANSILANVLSSDGTRYSVELARSLDGDDTFSGTIGELPPGFYVASIPQFGSQRPVSDDFTVMEPAGEMQRLQMDTAGLRAAAEISEGEYFPLERGKRVWRALPKGRQVNVASLPPATVWNMPLPIVGYALLFLGLLSCEWILRKRVGMI